MSKALRVLVVDDDFRVAGIHAAAVEAAPGFTVAGTVRTIAEARVFLAGNPVDLLLADIYLPDGDGIDLVQVGDVDAFILSAADDVPTVCRALRAGALAYLVKPFSQRVLIERLDRYARYRHVLSGSQGLSQDKVDQALSILNGAQASIPTSRSTTEQLLLDALEDRELSAAEAAEITGVSRATAQRRLATMASGGVVQVRLRYGQSGRPEHLYSRGRL